MIQVCDDDSGWKLSSAPASMDDIKEILGKPKEICRVGFWSKKFGFEIPPGRALVWTYELINEKGNVL